MASRQAATEFRFFTKDVSMTDNSPDTPTIVSAFAARAGLRLSPDELAKLSEYVVDTWDMADQLRNVQQPGVSSDVPKRSGWSNLPAAGASPATFEQTLEPGPVDPSVLEGSLVDAAGRIAAGELTPLDLVAAQ